MIQSRRPEEFRTNVRLRDGILERLAEEARKYRGQSVLLCFACDPYPPGDNEPTREAIRILVSRGVRFEVLTKGGLRASRDFDLYEGRGRFGQTIVFTRDSSRKLWEPRASRIEERIAALEQARAHGMSTWVSLEPVVKPDEALALIREAAALVDQWRIGRLNYHPQTKQVDWWRFGRDLARTLEETGVRYIVKESLAAFLPSGFPRRNWDDPWYQVPVDSGGQGTLGLGLEHG